MSHCRGTRGIPGLLRSIYATDTGTQVPGTRSFITDQDSPFSERWRLVHQRRAVWRSNMGNAA